MSRPTYFLSDLHVRAPDDARTAHVLRFLADRRGEAEAVYLVGDLFDFWLGYRSVVFAAYFPLLRALAELAESGTRVVVFSGNHDPDPGGFLPTLGVEVATGPRTVEVAGRRVWIEHGDVLDPRGVLRRAICRAARHPLAHRVARAVHPDLAWGLSRVYARAHVEDYAETLHPALTGDYFAERVAAGADVVVLGHYHRAVVHRVDGPTGERALFCLGDWVAQRTFLRAADGRFELLRDRGPDRPPVGLPPGDHGPPPAED